MSAASVRGKVVAAFLAGTITEISDIGGTTLGVPAATDTIRRMLKSASDTSPALPAAEEVTAVPVPVEPDDRYGGRFTFAGSLRNRAARGTLINSAFMLGLGILSLLKGFILARFLSRADYGVWGVIIVSLSTLLWLKQVGIGDKFIQQDELDQELAFQKAFTLELAITGLCVLVMAAVVPLLVLLYDLPQIVLPSLVIAAALLVSVFQAPIWVYYRRMDFARERSLSAVDPVTQFIVSIALALAGAGYWSFVGGIAAGACASSVVAAAVSPFKLRLRYERGTLRSYWSFSAPLVVAGISSMAMSWSAVVAAKLELGVAAVGVIALASNITAFTDRVDAMVTGALYPAICAIRDRTALLYESLVKSNRLALMWAVPFGVGVTLFCSDLVRYAIGERWRPAVIVLEVYGVAAAINHVGFNWTAYFRAIGETRPIAAANVAATVVFVVIGIPLLLAFGLPGFAGGVAIQGLLALVLRAYYLQRIFPAFHFLRHAARSFAPTVPAAAAVLLIRVLDRGTHSLGLALGELALYIAIAALATWWLESELLRDAASLVRRERTP
jgi:O-antigen/teichoic acid export membrane protein